MCKDPTDPWREQPEQSAHDHQPVILSPSTRLRVNSAKNLYSREETLQSQRTLLHTVPASLRQSDMLYRNFLFTCLSNKVRITKHVVEETPSTPLRHCIPQNFLTDIDFFETLLKRSRT
jgi:hypothetical protein